MGQTLQLAFWVHFLTSSSEEICEVGTIDISISEMKKWSLREGQSHS